MNIAIVDDDPRILASLVKFLSSIDHHVFSFERAADAMQTIQAGDIQLVLSDISMPGMDGFALLDAIKGAPHLRGIPVILFTGKGEVKDAVNAMKKGAYDYLLKPIDLNELMLLIERIGEYLSLRQENAELRNRFDEKWNKPPASCETAMRCCKSSLPGRWAWRASGFLRRHAPRVRDGRAVPRRPLHSRAHRGRNRYGQGGGVRVYHYGPEMSPQPFVDLNCASISPHLFESEIFGYEAGAFTGAKSKGEKGKKAGRERHAVSGRDWRAAAGVSGQAAAGHSAAAVLPCGRAQEAHHQRPHRVRYKPEHPGQGGGGEMRKDFYYRFQVGHLIIPPLRERPEAVLPLAALFLDQFRTSKKTRFERIHPSAAALLRHIPGTATCANCATS
jgi:DNA-binding NtrC family response regulator